MLKPTSEKSAECPRGAKKREVQRLEDTELCTAKGSGRLPMVGIEDLRTGLSDLLIFGLPRVQRRGFSRAAGEPTCQTRR